MAGWIKTQYDDIKGNAKWALLAALWWLVVTFGKKMLQQIPNIPGWLIWAILSLLSLVVFVWLAKSARVSRVSTSSSLQIAPQRPSAFPSLSALQGQPPQVSFDAREHFRLAYYSPLTAEIENNIKIAAEQNQPDDHEAFYARFIGVGLLAYLHDTTWWVIFKSQLLMLTELNRRNGVMALSDARAYYDRAVVDYPHIYTDYSFDQWLTYMTSQQLIIRHPTDMLEVTHRGRDLLRYLAHWGRDANAKAG